MKSNLFLLYCRNESVKSIYPANAKDDVFVVTQFRVVTVTLNFRSYECVMILGRVEIMNDSSLSQSRASSCSKLPHSQSTPVGVDGGARTPPTTPKKGGKMLAVKVQMLDDSVTIFQVQV